MNSPHSPKGQPYEPVEMENAGYDAHNEERLKEKLRAFTGDLAREAERRVGLRNAVERRWLEDLLQKHGRYNHDTEVRLTQKKKSRLFINKTRTKTNTLSSKLSDILFPTEDRNWGIKPTPVPELSGGVAKHARLLQDATDTMNDAKARENEARTAGDVERQQAAAEDRAVAEGVMARVQAAKELLDEQVLEATKRSDLMQEEIEDQLVSCKYSEACRKVIEDACDVGLGVMKGPVTGYKPRARWKREMDEEGGDGRFQMSQMVSNAPAMYRVDYWSFFPDPDYPNVADGEGIYERHLMNGKQLRKLGNRPDIDRDALRRVLEAGPKKGANPTFLVELEEITGQKNTRRAEMYQVWEYTGIVEGDQIAMLAEAFGREGLDEFFLQDGSDTVDPLAEMNVRIWFCQDEILSFALHPLDSAECLYSTFVLEKDETSPFGFGIPYLMRHPQALLNAAFRTMSDNAGLASGPQIVVNKSVVQPQNGEYTIEGNKIWDRQSGDVPQGERPFETYDIPMHLNELVGMIELASDAIDDVTYPAIVGGVQEEGTQVQQTYRGMAMLMNAANVIFRRWVKNYDDGITKPDIRRMYDFNMQYSEKEEIKGDYEIDARGSSVLLVREIQQQNLALIVDTFTEHPTYGPMLNEREAFEHLLKANMLPVNELLRSRSEYEAELERRRNTPAPEVQAAQIEAQDRERERELRMQEMQSKERMAQQEWEARMQIAQLEFDREMHRIAESLNMKVEDLKAKLQIASMSASDKERAAQVASASSERRLAAEVAMKERTGDSSGGAI